MRSPTVAIIIPAYNEETTIIPCLESCVNQSVQANEIIVVDNNSKDKTNSLVRSFIDEHKQANIRLVEEPEQGLIPARDRGFAESKCDVMGRVDADVVLDHGWVECVKETFSDELVDAATGPVSYHDMPLTRISASVDHVIRKFLYSASINHKFLFGSNMAVRRSTWFEVCDKVLPDPEDEFHEDISIALAFTNAGRKLAYCPNMTVGISARRLEDNPKDFYRYMTRYERTLRAYHVKNPNARIPMFVYLALYFPTRTVRKFYDPKTGKFTFEKLKTDLAEIKQKREQVRPKSKKV